MWVVNALANSTFALLYDFQSERAQAVALRVGVFVEDRKWRNRYVKGDMKLDPLVEFVSFTCSVFAFGMQQQTGIVTYSVGVSSVSFICFCIRKLVSARTM